MGSSRQGVLLSLILVTPLLSHALRHDDGGCLMVLGSSVFENRRKGEKSGRKDVSVKGLASGGETRGRWECVGLKQKLEACAMVDGMEYVVMKMV